MDLDSDIALVKRARDGDFGAFERLFERHRQLVYRFAYQMAPRRDDAEDIVQEAFVRAYQNLNKYRDELTLFSNANTETLHKHIDEVVNIGGIVSKLKRSKIKKGPNEGKMMAKFVLDDQFGSVDVVVFSDLYAKYAKWLDNGVAILLTAAVKDTGGQQTGRSASLQSAEQAALNIDDEYGGHPEARGARISAYELSEDDLEDERDPKEIENEKYGDRKDNFSLFGGGGQAPSPVPENDVDAFNEATAAIEEAPAPEPQFAAHAAAFSESPITPELNALEIIQLEGIRDKRVKEIALEVRYSEMDEERVRKIRELVEDHLGEIPVTITIIDVPEELGGPSVRMKVNHHFRVQPGPELKAALELLRVRVQYVFPRNPNAA